MSPTHYNQSESVGCRNCNLLLCFRGLDSAGCKLVVLQQKRKVVEYVCHFAIQAPSCSIHVTICGGISEIHIYDIVPRF